MHVHTILLCAADISLLFWLLDWDWHIASPSEGGDAVGRVAYCMLFHASWFYRAETGWLASVKKVACSPRPGPLSAECDGLRLRRVSRVQK